VVVAKEMNQIVVIVMVQERIVIYLLIIKIIKVLFQIEKLKIKV